MDRFSRDFTLTRTTTRRVFKLFNGRGLLTFLIKEILRFLNIPVQTLLAPVVSSLLFLAIFTTAWSRSDIGGIDFPTFLACGLVVMSIMQNSFTNGSSSILHSKILGNVGDILMPPLTPLELTIGYIGASLTRGLMVGTVVGIAMLGFANINPATFSVGLVILYAINGSVMMGGLGMLSGVIANKFDHMASISNFIIMPLTFLSGTFYAVSSLPEKWQVVAIYNPVHYAIDGFRYAVVGYNDSSLADGLIVCLCFNSFLLFLCWLVFKTGYRLEN